MSTILSPHSVPAPSFQIDKLDLDGHKKYTRTNLFLPLTLSLASHSYVVSFQHDDNHVLFAVKSITKRALQLLRAYAHRQRYTRNVSTLETKKNV